MILIEMLMDEEALAELPIEKRILVNLPKNRYVPLSLYPWEERGKGMNRCDYFVCTNLGEGTWLRLPMVRPIHIAMARDSMRILTGDLNAPVGDLPGGLGHFPGVEAHYLRAQIARISSSCHISPAGVYEMDEDDEPEEGVRLFCLFASGQNMAFDFP